MKATYFPALLLLAGLASRLLAQPTTATLVASYNFDNTLNSSRRGGGPLIAVNPLNQNRFLTDTVLGTQRTVYEWNGAAANAQQGGLAFNARDLINRTSYSLEFIFRFNPSTGYRRILDLSVRTLDAGLYLNGSNRLEWFPSITNSTVDFPATTYNHLVFVVTGNSLNAYVNNQLALRSTGNFNSANITDPPNPNQILNLFLDNGNTGSTNEWAAGRIALFRAYDGPLTADQVAQIFRAPFSSTIGIAAPSFLSTGVFSGASFSTVAPISANGYFTIFGSNLADAAGVWDNAFVDGAAPRTLNGVRVLVQDQESFVSFTSGGQLNVLAPSNIPEGPVSLVVENNGLRSTPVIVESRRINPGLFRFGPNNNRYFASTANDGSAFIAPSNLFDNSGVLNGLPVRPARPGEFIVLYGSGLGPTDPLVPGGQIPPVRAGGYPIANSASLRLTSTDRSVTRTLTPAYSGLSGFPGLFQVVFAVPADFADGDYEAILTVAGAPSPSATFVPVRR